MYALNKKGGFFMKHCTSKRCSMGALLCSLALMTGCYPGDANGAPTAETVSPEEVLQPENENLTLDLSVDEVSTDTFAAYNGLVAVKRPWDMDKVKALFSEEAEIVSEKKRKHYQTQKIGTLLTSQTAVI